MSFQTFHINPQNSIETSSGPVLYLKVTAQGAVVAASDSMVFLIKNGQVEHRRQLKHIKVRQLFLKLEVIQNFSV